MSSTHPLTAVAERVRAALQDAAREALGGELPDLVLAESPSPDKGDFAVSACLAAAKVFRKAPRAIADAVVAALPPIEGVARVEVAGPGYVNVFLDRKAITLALLAWLEDAPPPPQDIFEGPPPAPGAPKVVVEHTNINPNKAAHVGHLRNAILGDALCRLLQHRGFRVEVQNYIDDTGVQVADVVVAFTVMEGRSAAEAHAHVEDLIASEERPFDHACWDLYAAVGRWYAEDDARLEHRKAALHAMEGGVGELAAVGALVARAVVERHLALMDRIGVRYHLLPWESDILGAQFWATAFDRLKQSGAIQHVTEGKNAGCWVMPLTETAEFQHLEDPDKILVRGNGTVTYTGKDIAFQMWKFGLLGADFRYRELQAYDDGKPLWTSDTKGGSADGHPEFGAADRVYNVIDVRQSYPQAVVKNALLLTGHEAQAAASIHYSYEMVALSPSTAEALGFELSDEDRQAPYIEMSGRKGLGVKASDLLDLLVGEARKRVASTNEERGLGLADQEIDATAEAVGVGALRYYMAKVTRNRVIAFDIDEALQFQGEAGPYLQYSAVRAANIFRKLADERGLSPDGLAATAADDGFELLATDATWEVVIAAARLPGTVARAADSLEIATLAKHGFVLCQNFNAFYRDNSVLHADTEALRRERAAIARLFLLALRQVLGLLGVPEPERM